MLLSFNLFVRNDKTNECHLAECRRYNCNTMHHAKRVARAIINSGFDKVAILNDSNRVLFVTEY